MLWINFEVQIYGTDKGKVTPVFNNVPYYGIRGISMHASPEHQIEVSDQSHAPPTLSPWNKLPVPTV
jgi:hypothetical protein